MAHKNTEPTKWVHWETAWHHVRRSPYQSLATIFVLTISFFVMSLFILIAGGSELALRKLEAKPQVTAFFVKPLEPEELETLKNQLSETGLIDRMEYISQEQALEIYKEQSVDNPLLLEMVTANILPASLEVSTKHPESLGQVANILSLHDGIEEVIFQKDIIDQLIKWVKFLRTVGVGLISLIAASSFLVIFIIIGMKVVLRRNEVEILRLLGASPGYIQWPFVIEGWLYGALGAVLGWSLTYIGVLYTTPYTLDLLWSLQLLPIPWKAMVGLLVLEILAGGIWSAIASWWAVKRYLKRV